MNVVGEFRGHRMWVLGRGTVQTIHIIDNKPWLFFSFSSHLIFTSMEALRKSQTEHSIIPHRFR